MIVVVADTLGPARGDSRALAALTPSQREWAEASERLWRRAHDIAERYPDVDVSDLYHALRCLQLTPSQRLLRALQRGRLRPHSR
jgi:hypothetical protein